jgi:hypothetical protein
MQGSLPSGLHITRRWFSPPKTETVVTIQRVFVWVYISMYVTPYVTNFGKWFRLLSAHIKQTSDFSYPLCSKKHQNKKNIRYFCVRETPQEFWKHPNSAVQGIPQQRLKNLQTMRHTAVMYKLPYMQGEPQIVLRSSAKYSLQEINSRLNSIYICALVSNLID